MPKDIALTWDTDAQKCKIAFESTSFGDSKNLLSANQANVETDLTGLLASGGVLTRDVTKSMYGNASAKLVTAVAGDNFMAISGPQTLGAFSGCWPITYGETRSFSAYVFSDGAAIVSLRIVELDSLGNVLADNNGVQTTAAASWVRLTWNGFTPTNPACSGALIRIQNGGFTFGTMYFDGMQWESGALSDFHMPGERYLVGNQGKNDLATTFSLLNCVLISLFTDARAADDDVLPDQRDTDRRGWWADSTNTAMKNDSVGSKLWLLEREKNVDTALVRAKIYIQSALEWMVDEGAVKSIDVLTEAQRLGNSGTIILVFQVKLNKPDGTNEAFKFEQEWRATADGI